jgi:hypothetical protein
MSNNTKTPFKNIENQYIFSKKKHFFAKNNNFQKTKCTFDANLHQTYTCAV